MNNDPFPRLLRAIAVHSGKNREALLKVNPNQVQGINGFKDPLDCVAFYAQHRRLIWQVLQTKSRACEKSMLEMFHSFSSSNRVVDAEGFETLLVHHTVKDVVKWFHFEEELKSKDEIDECF